MTDKHPFGLVLFDLDGTMISSYMEKPIREYHNWETIFPVVGIVDHLITKNHAIAVVTNQGGVAFDFITERDFWIKAAAVALEFGFHKAEIYDGKKVMWVGWENTASGAVLTACDRDQPGTIELARAPLKVHPRRTAHSEVFLRFYVSYDHPKAKLPQYAGSERRKSSPAMLEEAIAHVEQFHGERQRWQMGVTLIGDSPTDQHAAIAAGVEFCSAEVFDIEKLSDW